MTRKKKLIERVEWAINGYRGPKHYQPKSMKSKTPITCWSCNTVYDYQKHEVCPICENHFLDGQARLQALPPSPVSGTRVSISIDSPSVTPTTTSKH